MNKKGPIVIIEDDPDDQEIFQMVLKNISIENELLFFKDGFEALAWIKYTSTEPFLLISDTNLPILSGYELRDKILNNQQLSARCTPYLLFTTAASHQAVVDAYCKSVQGFFIKPSSYKQIERMMLLIIAYWNECTA